MLKLSHASRGHYLLGTGTPRTKREELKLSTGLSFLDRIL